MKIHDVILRAIDKQITWLEAAEIRVLPLPAHRVDEFPVGYSWRVALQCLAHKWVKTIKEP
ncbi:MAG: hypothetical protein WAV47_17295 [Blastocatellia bacterium]